jgi:hypothetical protein
MTSRRFHPASTNQDALYAGIDIVPVGCDEQSINRAATFMVEAFWLGTKRQMVEGSNGNDDVDDENISNDARSRLVKDQAFDLNEKYGERMGNRILPSLLLQAVDYTNGETVGLVGLEVSLLDRSKPDILSPKLSEEMLKNAIASLGPKTATTIQGQSCDSTGGRVTLECTSRLLTLQSSHFAQDTTERHCHGALQIRRNRRSRRTRGI